VEDAIQGLLLAVESEKTGEVYLITNREPFPFDEIGLVIRKALGKSPRLLYVPERAALLIASVIENIYTLFGKEPPVGRKNIESTLADRVFSSDKAQRELGFKPDVDPRLGLSETVEWYQKKGWI
jgi:nucleoside-diphosphate-sugar epimerase